MSKRSADALDMPGWVDPLATQVKELDADLKQQIEEAVRVSLDPVSGPTTPILLRVMNLDYHDDDDEDYERGDRLETLCLNTDAYLFALWPSSVEAGFRLVVALLYVYRRSGKAPGEPLIESVVRQLGEEEAGLMVRKYVGVRDAGTVKGVYVPKAFSRRDVAHRDGDVSLYSLKPHLFTVNCYFSDDL